MNSIRLGSRRQRARHGLSTAVILLFALVLFAQPGRVLAAEGVRTVSIGESNSETQVQEILSLLNASAADQTVSVSVAETFQTMDGVFDLSGVDSAYSSTALTCASEGAGIDVLTRNIEVIPPELYALTLLTAGVSDVQLSVAAPTDAPALGMTALTGVFKTWDLAACSPAGADPARRQLAVEQLALIAGIGEDREAIRETTLVVLDAQQQVIGKQLTAEEIGAIVAAEADEAGLELGDTDRAAIVDYLGRLAGTPIDWGRFTSGWTTQFAEDGSGVVLTANAAPAGATGSIPAAPVIEMPASPSPTPVPSPTVVPTATATPRSTLVLPAATPPAISNDTPSSATGGTVTEAGRDSVTRWWPLAALVLVGAPLLGFLARRKGGGKLLTTLYARRRSLGGARRQVATRETRRPVMSQQAGQIRRVRINRDIARS